VYIYIEREKKTVSYHQVPKYQAALSKMFQEPSPKREKEKNLKRKFRNSGKFFSLDYCKKMKVGLCAFSGFKIYPGHGIKYVRGDSKHFTFVDPKNEALFLGRKNPRKIRWTQVYRRLHKKGIVEETTRKRTRKTQKLQRAIVGATLEAIKQKRNQKPEERAATREAALREIKARKKALRDEKAKAKAAPKANPQPTKPANKLSKQPKQAKPKMPKGQIKK